MSWIEREVESKATKFLKKCLHVPQGGNPQLLYLPREDGGLALPALSTLYNQQQASRHVLLRTSRDDSVRALAEKSTSTHKGKFCPPAVASEVQSHNITCSKRQLKTQVARHISDNDSAARQSHLASLSVQGRVFHMDCDLTYWAEAISSLPDREMRFAYNVAIDTLPSNANLALWYRGQASAQYKLCSYPTQSLKHILNRCEEALALRRFNKGHVSVLSLVNTFITTHLKQSNVLADLPGQHYAFPVHIAATDERPDIIKWNDKHCTLIELSVPYEDNFADAEKRKRDRYEDLLHLCTSNGYKARLMTIQVGSRGILDMPSLTGLWQLCQLTAKEWKTFLVSSAKAAIMGSFTIWCFRNTR